MGAHAVYVSPLTLNVSQPPFMPAQMTLTSTCAARERSPGCSSKACPYTTPYHIPVDDFKRFSAQVWQCICTLVLQG